MTRAGILVQEVGKIGENEFEEALDFAERFDFTDIQILRKFYVTGKKFPFDTQPHCFPLLFKEMRDGKQFKFGVEALRKRLENMVRMGFLTKIRHSNPVNYGPVKGKEKLVGAIILKFFALQGLSQSV